MIVDVFQAHTEGQYAALTIVYKGIDTITKNIKDVLLPSTKELLGIERRKNKPWMTTKLMDLCYKRRELMHEYTVLDSTANYQKANREVRKKMKEAKEEWHKEQCIIIDKVMTAGSSKNAYGTRKTLAKTSQPKVNVILLTEIATFLNRWHEYCSLLQNDPRLEADDESPPILKEEVAVAVRSLKDGKSPEVSARSIPGWPLR